MSRNVLIDCEMPLPADDRTSFHLQSFHQDLVNFLCSILEGPEATFTESALIIERLLASEQKEGIFEAGPVYWEMPGGFYYGYSDESKGASGFQKPKGLPYSRMSHKKVLKICFYCDLSC